MKNILQKVDFFIIGLLLMILLAFTFPYSAEYSTLQLDSFVYWGISGIFFLYGLKLNLRVILEDLRNWRLHILIQSTTFLLFPLLVLIVYPFIKGTNYEIIWLGCLFLSALPSTVSSSVVMVSIAKGNIPSAIFNASISGLLGLLFTPLWMGIFISKSSESLNILNLISELFLQILLPVIIGVILNKFFIQKINKYKQIISWFDKLVIFLIVYKSFSAAFLDDIFSALPIIPFSMLAMYTLLLFFIVYFIIYKTTTYLRFTRSDKITALFCGSKKSLVHGSVFITLLITDTSQQSLFLLPIMIYHSFQLLFTSYIARKMAKQES